MADRHSVNTMTGVMAPDSAVIDRQTETFYCPVLGVAPEGYETARQAEKEELDRERIRLWYVAATRARELLVLPRLDTTPSKSAWIGLVDLSLADLPGLDVSHLPAGLSGRRCGSGQHPDTRELRRRSRSHRRRADAPDLARAQPRRKRLGTVLREEEAELWTGSADDQPPELEAAVLVQGGRERGLILHKLMEEVLTGETKERAALTERAGRPHPSPRSVSGRRSGDGAVGEELAACVVRTLALPEIAALRPGSSGRISRLCRHRRRRRGNRDGRDRRRPDPDAEGRPAVVVDWKSDVNPERPDARSLSRAGAGLSRHDRRRARTDRADDLRHRDHRLAHAPEDGGLTRSSRWSHASAPPVPDRTISSTRRSPFSCRRDLRLPAGCSEAPCAN
jgi:hypothetical protein